MPAAAVGDSPDWPPPGWTEDVKITNGRKIKYYTNVETGKKFYSKKEVSRYMNTKDTCHDVTQAVNNQDKSCSENKVSQMNDQDESLSKNNVNQMNNQDKSCSENNVNQTVGGPNNSYEWLPPGWTVELKTRKSGSHAGTTYKVYIDPSTGDKFYSKPEVSKHLKTMKQNNVAGEVQIHANVEVSSSNQKTSEDSKNVRAGARLGIEKGSVSKKKASQDSEEVGEQSGISKRKKSGIKRLSTKTSPSHGAGEDFPLIEKTSLGSKENGEQRPQSKRQKPGSDCPSTKSVSSVAVDCNSVDELPPGWKKEFINQENDRGTRKDLLYADPVHGYKFRSKKEVLRYLQTGDASRCARRPAKRNAASTTKDDSPVTDDARVKKVGFFMTGRQLFATDESKGGKFFGTCLPAPQVESSKKQLDCSVSDPNIIISSILAEINENHSLENATEDTEIKPVNVGVEQPSAVSTESNVLPEKQILENEPEKPSYKAATQQSRKSRNKESLNLGRRVSKRLAGQNSVVEPNLDPGERALLPVVEKSASPSLSMNVCGQELLQDSDPTLETGNSGQASLNGEASVDELPQGWKKETKITKKLMLYIDPVHGYVFRSKKDVFRYLQTGDINSCAIRPVKRDQDAAMKESSPTAANTNSKNLGCSATEKKSFAAKKSRGRRRSVTCSPEVPAESSKKQAESSVSDANTIITSSAADVNAKHSNENVIENAEMSLDTEPEVRDSSADTKVIAAENDTIIKLSAVSTPPPDLPPKQQLPETEHEKHKNKEKLEQSRRSKTKKPLTPGRRISKRLVGHSPEPVADMDLGERAFRAVVKKSASLGTPGHSTVGTGNSDQTSLSREASGDKLPPGLEKEMLAQNKDPTVGTGNSDQASLNMEASGDKLLPGLEKEMLAQNNDPTVGTGNSDQASLSREASGNELLEKEILAQNRDPIVGTGNSDQASLSREASGNELPPGLEKEIPTQCKYPSVGTGNSDQASPSRKASGNEFSPGLGKEIPTQDRDMTLGTGNSDQASPSRKASGNELSPSLEKEIPNQHKDPMVGTGNSDQASPSRKTSGNELPGLEKEIPTPHKDLTVGTGNTDQASLRREALPDEIPPGWEKEILAQNKYPTVGTGSSDQASLRRKLSPDEIPPGWENVIPAGWKNEIPDQNKDPIVGTRNFDQASLSREAASLDDIPPGWENEILAYKKDPRIRIGNSDQVSLSRESASADELPPGWEKQMLTRNKDPTVGTGNSNSMDDVPPGWEKELFVQTKDRTVGTGNSYQSFPSREASVDELPPGWQKELRPRKSDHGLKDPYYTHPDHGYVFRSKKDVMRYLQTGDIRSCVVRPTKRPSTLDTSSKKLGCSLTGRQLSATEETKGRKCSVTCSLAVQAESSIERPECSVFNLNVNEDAGRRLDMEPEIRNSIGDRKSVDVESVDDRRSLAISSRSDFHLEQQLPDNEKAKHSNKGVPGRSRKLRNSKSSTPVRRVSKRLSRHNTEMVADFDIGERVLRAVANNSASTGLPLNVSGGKLTLTQQTNLTGDSGPPSLSRRPQDDPLKIVECPSEGQAFKEQNVVNKLSSGKHNEERISEDAQPAGISYESGKVHLERQVVKERSIQKLAKEQDSQNRFLSNSQPAELASGRRVFHAEDQSVSEGSSIEQVSEKLDYENKQWKASHLAEPSWRSVDLNVENQQLQYSQQAPSQGSVDLNVENQQWQYAPVVPSQGSVDLNVENQQWQYSQLAPSQRSVDLNVENQQRQDSQLAPSQRIVDLNVANQQWQDSQLAQPSLRSVDLNVNQPVREKHTGELVTENQDEQNRRLHAQLASYPFGDYWSDPCMEFAFKTLTGAIPVEDNMAYQGSTHQEYSTSYSHADDGCFELPLFNTSNFYMNDAPNHCAPPEVHVVKEQPPINPTFSPTGNNSMPGYSSSVSQNPSLAFPYGSNSTPGFSNVVSQNPGLVFMPNGSNSIPGRGSVVSQNPGMDTQAKDYQSKFRSQR
ncbi:unnamed protein product [Withania somnifera]